MFDSYAGRAAVAVETAAEWSTAALVSTDGNRWSRPGEPTIYLALDPAVAIAELARHLPVEQPIHPASVWTVDVDLEAVVDLRDGVGTWTLDAERCRDAAADFRRRGAQGLLVPSVAFLDRPDRANLVVFADVIGDLDRAIGNPQRLLSIRRTSP
jgi:RES domain-containing protein